MSEWWMREFAENTQSANAAAMCDYIDDLTAKLRELEAERDRLVAEGVHICNADQLAADAVARVSKKWQARLAAVLATEARLAAVVALCEGAEATCTRTGDAADSDYCDDRCTRYLVARDAVLAAALGEGDR